MTEQLKACPFCGETNHGIGTIYTTGMVSYVFWQSCNAYGPSGADCDEGVAKSQWNTRTGNWISVKDDLPKTNGRPGDRVQVLVVSDGITRRDMHFTSNGRFVYGSLGYNSTHTVTHWMPLPEPPTISKKETTENE